jgi:general nucleoside transport system ATP-binding protein
MTHRLDLKGITKRYPSVVANEDISLQVQAGEIHAVLGENGAGKSTLMKIIYGAVKPDAGEMLFNGLPVQVKSPQHARSLGISMVFQHFSLFETFTVAQNVWLGLKSSLSLEAVSELIVDKARAYGLEIDPSRPVHTLGVGEMQRVEIIRALLSHPQLLIMDEPTSVLTPQAVEKLFEVLRRLSSQGCSILYISHKLHEIRELCSHCTVLRNGRVTGVCRPSQESNESLSRLMIGVEPKVLHRQAQPVGERRLRVQSLNLTAQDQFGTTLRELSLEVHSGEVVGIAGVSGNGQKELLMALSGEDTRVSPESIQLLSRPVGDQGPRVRRAMGLHVVAEDRLGRNVVADMSLKENMMLTREETLSAWGVIHPRALLEQTQDLLKRFNVKSNGPLAKAKSLSGGNLQKFIMGREMDAKPQVFIVSQPTWGVDVGSAAQIRSQLLALKQDGCAVLVVSEELDELFEICDRLYVMALGRLSPSVHRQETTLAEVGVWMSGLWEEPHALPAA